MRIVVEAHSQETIPEPTFLLKVACIDMVLHSAVWQQHYTSDVFIPTPAWLLGEAFSRAVVTARRLFAHIPFIEPILCVVLTCDLLKNVFVYSCFLFFQKDGFCGAEYRCCLRTDGGIVRTRQVH